jgi:hypothetical protein
VTRRPKMRTRVNEAARLRALIEGVGPSRSGSQKGRHSLRSSTRLTLRASKPCLLAEISPRATRRFLEAIA